MATANITIPKPPRLLRIDRHSNIAFGIISTSGRMVAPVVLNPDIVSNKASAK